MRTCYTIGLLLLIQCILGVHFSVASQVEEVVHAQVEKLVSVNDGILSIDAKQVPIIYGAEIQYFRLRGGAGKNIPKKLVIELWNRVLTRAVEAGINAIGISIPWDFHEYEEGKFDFDGNVDEDKDGNPDYPSRDLNTFFTLIEDHNIKIVMIKPGPYIKSDWGFAGIGAIPLWFHEKYSESHMMNSEGLKNKLFDYNDDNFQKHVHLWFQALYQQVLFDKIGMGKPIKFLQLDNEINYAGQNILQVDYSARSVRRYQNYLKERYLEINAVNRSQGSSYVLWENIKPPISVNESRGSLRDWYDYLDFSTGIYLEKLRKSWETIGVSENQILFTSADNNIASDFGILPNTNYRNNKARTALMTVNLYPKTYYSYEGSLLNYPFKADFDVKNASMASQNYLGYKNPWVMGSEVEFGGKKNIYLSDPAIKQIFFSALGQGMKAFFIQHFADGWNWQWDWLQDQVRIIKQELKIPGVLNDEQWERVQSAFEKKQFTGIDVRAVLDGPEKDLSVLTYDGVLDLNGNPKQYFQLLKTIGQKVVIPYGFVLSAAKPIEDFVSVFRDFTTQSPNYIQDISSSTLNTEWSGGLLSMLIHAKVQPSFAMKGVDLTSLRFAKIVFSIDGGSFDSNTALNVSNYLKRGGVLVNFLGVSMLKQLGLNLAFNRVKTQSNFISLNHVNIISPAIEIPVLKAPMYSYTPPASCRNLLSWKGQTMAFVCNIAGGTFIQMGTLFFEDFNTDTYASPSLAKSKKTRLGWFDYILREQKIPRSMNWFSESLAVSAVSRIWELNSKTGYWVTLRSADRDSTNIKLQFPNIDELVKLGTAVDDFQITEVLSGNTKQVSLKTLKEVGIVVNLSSQGSEMLSITPILK